MPKIVEVVSSMTVKVNVGDYQSVDFFTALKAESPDALKATEELHALLNRATLSKLRAHFKARGKKYTDEQICRIYGLAIPAKPKPEFG